MDEWDLTALLHRHASSLPVPGAAIGVVRNGTVTTAAYGVADATSGDPVTSRTRFAGVYAWPDRRIEVTAMDGGLLLDERRSQTEALPIDERTFLVDPSNPDTPTVTFGGFDHAGRPHILYDMLWGLPRRDG